MFILHLILNIALATDKLLLNFNQIKPQNLTYSYLKLKQTNLFNALRLESQYLNSMFVGAEICFKLLQI